MSLVWDWKHLCWPLDKLEAQASGAVVRNEAAGPESRGSSPLRGSRKSRGLA